MQGTPRREVRPIVGDKRPLPPLRKVVTVDSKDHPGLYIETLECGHKLRFSDGSHTYPVYPVHKGADRRRCGQCQREGRS